MTNIDAGRQRIRRLPDKPIVGELTPTPEAFTRWIGMMPSAIWHGYTGRRTAGSAAHTALRCTMCRVGVSSCSGITAPGASSVLTIAAKGGEAIVKPMKKSRLFQLPALPKAPWWLSLTIASVSLMVSVIALTR